jgi:hypothetical protein
MFIAEKNIWEAATSNRPALSSKNDDSAERHGPEMVGWCAYVCLGINKGDVSSGIGWLSPLAGKLELDVDDNDAYDVVESWIGRAVVITKGYGRVAKNS